MKFLAEILHDLLPYGGGRKNFGKLFFINVTCLSIPIFLFIKFHFLLQQVTKK